MAAEFSKPPREHYTDTWIDGTKNAKVIKSIRKKKRPLPIGKDLASTAYWGGHWNRLPGRRLHLGNGTIYLHSYTNIDLDQPHHFLAHERPDLVEENGTDVHSYYKHEVDRHTIEERSRHFREVVCDMFADIKNLPFREGTIDEIRLVQVFEHFTYEEGTELLSNWFKLLKIGGKLHIDIPDLAGTVGLYANADNDEDREWATRLLFGSQKNEWGIHKGMYTEVTLMQAMERAGFKGLQVLPNIHFYPGFAIEGSKL